MHEKIAEKIMEGSLFEKILNKEYFILFLSLVLYFDICLTITGYGSIINFTPSIAGDMPIGKLIISVALFSFLISIGLPTLFWRFNNCLWNTIEFLKIKQITEISSSDMVWLEKSTSGKDLMSWAIINSNPVAMAIAKEVINELDKFQNNRAILFSLACFIFANHLIATDGFFSILKSTLPVGLQCYYSIIPITLIAIVLYGAFSGPPIRSGHINLPGLDIKK